MTLLRQKGRPYLFSNTMAPAVVGAALRCFEMLGESTALVSKLQRNTRLFRDSMAELGFDVSGDR